jgi:hypothetical protein
MLANRYRALIAAAAATLLLAGSASATTVFLVLFPGTVHRGHTVTINGNAGDCPRGDSVTILSRAFSRLHEFAGVPAVYAKVGAGGRFHTTARIPLTRHAGTYVVTARCGGGNLGVKPVLRVT